MCISIHLERKVTFSKIKTTCILTILRIEELFEFCEEYLSMFTRFVGQTLKIIIRIKYREVKQKDG